MISLINNKTVDVSDFFKLSIVVGTILNVELNVTAKKPAYKLVIDFGDLGIKLSSAQITLNYTIEDLIGKQIVAVTNFPPKKVADVTSEVLVFAAVCKLNGTTLIEPTEKVQNGSRIL